MTVKRLERTFLVSRSAGDNITLTDPDPTWTPEQVKDFYMNTHPELTNASIHGPDVTSSGIKFTFKTSVGDKG